MRAKLHLIFLGVALACSDPTATTNQTVNFAGGNKVTSVTVQPTSLQLQVGAAPGSAQCFPRTSNGTLTSDPCTWVSRNPAVVSATSGSQTSTLTALSAGSTRVVASVGNKRDSLTVTVTAPPTQTPWTTAFAVPTTIQAEFFDRGGEGIAYHDTELTNFGGAFRTTEAVDVKVGTDVDGGYAVGYIIEGEWLEYSITVATAGNYDIESRVATPFTGKVFHLEIDGTNVTGPLAVPVTGPFDGVFGSVTKTGIPLTAGAHVLRFAADSRDFDVNSFIVRATAVPGITIAPGENWQTKVNANPPGTLFRPLAGTHIRPTVIPKTGDQFRCEPGTVMDGQNVTNYAFQISASAPYPDSVHIVGCRITNYHPVDLSQFAAIRGSGDNATISGHAWVVDSNEVDHSSQVGIRLGHQMKVRGNNVHHNGTFGISGPGDSVVVCWNQINDNGDPTHMKESGGTKFVLTNWLLACGNTVLRNQGPGLWTDIGNDASVIDSNTVENNYMEGIVVEISYGAIIRRNTVRRNGMNDPRSEGSPNGFLWGAGIGIHASGGGSLGYNPGIIIRDNLLEGNAQGISLIEQPRGTNHADPAGVDPEMLVKNVTIRKNTITLQTLSGYFWPASMQAIGGADQVAGSPMFAPGNVTSDSNTIVLNGKTFPWAWNGGFRNTAYWTGTTSPQPGFDLHSTITP